MNTELYFLLVITALITFIALSVTFFDSSLIESMYLSDFLQKGN